MRPLYYQDEKDFYSIDRGVTKEEVVEIVNEVIGEQPEEEAPVNPEGE